MENKLREVLVILEKLNSKANIVTKDDFIEQYDNLNDFKLLSKSLDELLVESNTVNLNDGNQVEEMVFELHRILTTFEWHFTEIRDLNIKIIKEYKDKISKN
ncbi:hypothetical protein CIB95_02215 [Lottiidibacillus patelloidae]|uniref:Uncharacterized protein n=1 Tax=Lottiidibacillus patelloidae TaxID=2670334 RepID=A0A263BZ09_9BACI|nr:hypothetical protein [Lottiidibacillus patelloidae]OZM58406.1 hypothetical protein CIB95_02215 [Lottiidibacillus patelloidae]